jgi:hypothetical protein
MEAGYENVATTLDGPSIAVVQHFNNLNQHALAVTQVFSREPTAYINENATQSSPSAKQPTTKDLLSSPYINPLVGLNMLHIAAFLIRMALNGSY